MTQTRLLALALFTLAATDAAWFWDDRHALAAMLVFGLPPLLLGVVAWRGWTRAGLSAGLIALLWFSHGVMVAWTRPPERAFAFAEILLALAIIYFASMPGLRARFRKRR
ncbi:DUF2069 domain-containing protein [Thermomonas sp.]|uniref:DUF2069 domain-containing protein n=1 Tax=Thermomonas sp. TaxID=1971895 RepID=UPI002488EBA0|nr:DUF2069 domain-containing protein [Thermomonas sp.]MDI1254435.1 DUF2069 domain-containing protein [Thermomonas sp.]